MDWNLLKENFSFVIVCIIIVVALALAAKLVERYLPDRRKVPPARRVSIIGICAAIATVLHMLDFPLLFLAPGFYKLDFSELPVLLCGFICGPLYGGIVGFIAYLVLAVVFSLRIAMAQTCFYIAHK